MALLDDRRRTPRLYFVLLITCVVLCGIVAAQQRIISNQADLIRLLYGDSAQLAQLKIEKLQVGR
jgi:hypothetical protein